MATSSLWCRCCCSNRIIFIVSPRYPRRATLVHIEYPKERLLQYEYIDQWISLSVKTVSLWHNWSVEMPLKTGSQSSIMNTEYIISRYSQTSIYSLIFNLVGKPHFFFYWLDWTERWRNQSSTALSCQPEKTTRLVGTTLFTTRSLTVQLRKLSPMWANEVQSPNKL